MYLYGSRARQDHREGSDIDIALDTGDKIDWNNIFSMKDAMEESNIPVSVDINNISNDFKEEILKDRVTWKG